MDAADDRAATDAGRGPQPRSRVRTLGWLAGLAVVITAINLRPAVTSFGALLPDLRQDIGMPSGLAGVITTLPPICFGVFGLLAGRWSRGRDTALVLSGAMVLTSASLVARVVVGSPELVLLWTVPALAGMAAGNVLLPVAVKRWFPNHVGRATGLYSTALAVGTALAAGGSVPVARAFGTWRAGLGMWAIPPLLAIPVWMWVRRHAHTPPPAAAATTPAATPASATATPSTVTPQPPPAPVHRQRKAWALAGYFGLQSLGAYAVMGWVPTIFQDAGVDASTAGLLLALITMLGAPISIVLPEIAARRDDQRVYVAIIATMAVSGYLGLLFAPAAVPVLWATLIGLGMGAFPLALVLIGLRARGADGTARLSSLSQGVGYLVAASGPVSIGLLHDVTGAWTVPLIVLIGLQVPQVVFGLSAAKPGHVD